MVYNRSGIFTSNFVCEECGLDYFRNYNQAEEHEIECRKNPLVKSIINSPLGAGGPIDLKCPYPKCLHTFNSSSRDALRDSLRYELPLETNRYLKTIATHNERWGFEAVLHRCNQCSFSFSIDKNLKIRSSDEALIEGAKRYEKTLDFDEAARIYDWLGMDGDLIRVRKLKAEMGSVKVAQKVVHGDEVSQTEIKDSVLNRSNVGGGTSKMQELEKLTEMKEKGLIDDNDYEKMKREIIG